MWYAPKLKSNQSTGLHYPPRVLDLGEVRNIWICGRAPNLWHGHSF